MLTKVESSKESTVQYIQEGTIDSSWWVVKSEELPSGQYNNVVVCICPTQEMADLIMNALTGHPTYL